MKKLILFDVDGPLTWPRENAKEDILEILRKLGGRDDVVIGFVGGSKIDMYIEQFGDGLFDLFDYCFAENGLVAYKGRELIYQGNLAKELREEDLNEFVSYSLKYISELKIPKKRGTFVQFRSGLINISPIGRDCSLEERREFNEYDNEHGVRKKMIADLECKFERLNLNYSIGGMISFDVMPKGWDKTFCLKHIKVDDFDGIYFFGNRTEVGGNDYEIYSHPMIKGFKVENPNDTIKIISEKFL
jgi:phosphomannomutase